MVSFAYSSDFSIVFNGGITTMVIVSKYRLERNEEKDIFSNQ